MPTCGLRKAQRSLMLKTICTLAASRQFPTCVKHSEAEDQIDRWTGDTTRDDGASYNGHGGDWRDRMLCS